MNTKSKATFTIIFSSLILFASCKSHPEPTGDLCINGVTFLCTSMVQVIPQNEQATIPNENCTSIGDVFFEGRTVTLDSYKIGKYEVTQELYEFVMGTVPFKDEENKYGSEVQRLRPAAGVNWLEAVVFCNKLSELCQLDSVYTIENIKYSNKGKENQYISSATVTWDISKNGYRLPTECEWEFAARGAGKSPDHWNYKFSGSDNSKKVAWTVLTSSGYSDDDDTMRTHQVGLKAPNACGIYDMSGNVSEWCMDWYRSVTEKNDFSHGNRVNVSDSELTSTNPIMLKGNYDSHTLRGGSYSESAGTSSNNQRLPKPAYAGYHMDASCANIGFRIACK